MATIIVLTLGTLPLVYMIHRIVNEQEYGWLFVMVFYYVFFAFCLYQLDKIFPNLL